MSTTEAAIAVAVVGVPILGWLIWRVWTWLFAPLIDEDEDELG